MAAEQLEYAVSELGARGASIGGTVLGEANSRSKYDSFWAKAAELDVPVFMHPSDSVYLLRHGGFPGRGNQGNVIGNPLETTFFLTNLIFDGVFDRFPGLRVCGAHGGGYLPSYLGRTEVACARNNANCLNMRSPSEYMREQIMADSMVFSAEGLRHLVAEMGASQIVYGSDQPFPWPDTMDLIVEADFLSDAEKIAILGGTPPHAAAHRGLAGRARRSARAAPGAARASARGPLSRARLHVPGRRARPARSRSTTSTANDPLSTASPSSATALLNGRTTTGETHTIKAMA